MAEASVDWNAPPLITDSNFDICLVGSDGKFVECQTILLEQLSPVFARLIEGNQAKYDESSKRSYCEVQSPGCYLIPLMRWVHPSKHTLDWTLNYCTTFAEFVSLATIAQDYDFCRLKVELCEALVILIRGTNGDVPIRYWGIAMHFGYTKAEKELRKRLAAQPLFWDLGPTDAIALEWVPLESWIWLARSMFDLAQPSPVPPLAPIKSVAKSAQNLTSVEWSDDSIVFKTENPDLCIITSDQKVIQMNKEDLRIASSILYELAEASQQDREGEERWVVELQENSEELVLLMNWLHQSSDWYLGKATTKQLGKMAEMARKYSIRGLREQVGGALLQQYNGGATDLLYIWSIAMEYKYQDLAKNLRAQLDTLQPVLICNQLDEATFPFRTLEARAFGGLVANWKTRFRAQKKAPLI